MKEKTPKSINELHYQIKAHSDILSDKALRSLWIEVPDHCHLHCQYCFANTERNTPHLATGILTSEEYLSLIEAFQEHGGQFLGIPGLGEPFHPANRALVLDIVESASKLDLQITVFTTGDALFWAMDPSRRYVDITGSTPDFSYADRLLQSNVILLVKVNSLKPGVQDKLVCQPGYTTARNAALNWLIEKYHLNRSRRLGIVTSIMPENTSEIESLYEYAHNNELIFDCDTILPRGRGNAFQKTHAVTCQEVRTIFSNIIRRSPGSQSGGGSYVGSSCDRVRHHLYVDVRGNAYPCIGCVDRHENLNIGNIRDRSLIDIWNDPLRLALREKYSSTVLGICSYCENFERGCWSCLGRWVKEYEFFADGPVLHTKGCFNHKPDLDLWVSRCAKFIRSQISDAPLDIRKKIRNDIKAYGLEVFWKCLPEDMLDFAVENRFPLIRKDITYTDLNIPFRDLWDLIDTDRLRSVADTEDVINSLIPRTLLPCLRLLADRHDHGFSPSPDGLGQSGKGNIQFCNLMFYQHHMHRGFYRTIAHNALDNRVLERPEHRSFVDEHREVVDQLQRDIELRNREVRLWQRWVETFEDRQGEIGLLVPHIADFSRLMEEQRVDTYELILSNSLFMKHRLAIHNDIVHGGECVLNVAAILDSQLIQNKLRSVHDVVHGAATNVELWNKIERVLSSVVFAYAEEAYSEPIKLLKDLFENMSAKAFYPSEEKIPPDELAKIEKELERVLRESLVSQLAIPRETTKDDRRLAEDIRACIFGASWSDLCDTMRQLLRSRKYKDEQVPNMFLNIYDRHDRHAIKCLHNPILLHLFFLFVEENASGRIWSSRWLNAINYFVWLAFFRDYCEINCYFAHYAPNLRLHLNILTDEEINYSSPSGMILGSTDRLSKKAKQDYEQLYDFVMNPFEELLQTEYMNSETAKHQERLRNLELAESAYGVGHTQKDRFTKVLTHLEHVESYLMKDHLDVQKAQVRLALAQRCARKAVESSKTMDFMANLFQVNGKIEDVNSRWLVPNKDNPYPGAYIVADHIRSELDSFETTREIDLSGLTGVEIRLSLMGGTRRLYDEFYDDIISEIIGNAVRIDPASLIITFETINVPSESREDQFDCLVFSNNTSEENFQERLGLSPGRWSPWPISENGPKGGLRQIAIRLRATQQGWLFAMPEYTGNQWRFRVALHVVNMKRSQEG